MWQYSSHTPVYNGVGFGIFCNHGLPAKGDSVARHCSDDARVGTSAYTHVLR